MMAVTRRSLLLALLACSLVTGCVSQRPPPPGEVVRVGALLPFTGDLASTGENVERGLLMAIDAVNAEGGIGGRPLVLVSRDTHSDAARGLESARELIALDVAVIVGPEEGELVPELAPLIDEAGIPLLTISEAASSVPTSSPLRFHVGPTAAATGRALAQRMFRDRQLRASIVAAQGDYGDAFVEGVRGELVRLGGTVLADERFDPEASSNRALIERALDPEPDALVLVAYPRSGARLVADAAALSVTPRWYLAPTLNDQAFLSNISPNLMDGAVGVSAEVGDEAGGFGRAFAARWSGERPLPITHFYFDALVLWALAAESVSVAGGAESISDALLEMSRPPGDVYAWYEVEAAFGAVRAGMAVDYCGASSSLDLTDDRVLAEPFLGFWAIADDHITREPAVFRSLCHFVGG